MAVKVLVVDDEPDLESLIRQKFRREIRKNKYEFHFASDGSEALQVLAAEPAIELVLTDINMPRMDGLSLLSHLQDLNHPVLKAVIVSAYGDLDNIRTAMNRGAFDFLTKPIDLTDLEVTVTKALGELSQLREALRTQTLLVSMEQELDAARKIQQGIVPCDFPAFPERPEFDVYGEMIPARQVGGDFFDYFLLSNNRLGFVIADVSGKGMPAAIFMAVSRGLLKAVAAGGIPPGRCLQEVNSMLCADNPEGMFVTTFYGILDISTGEVQYSNGGHNPPYLVRRDGPPEELGGPTGIVLGIMDTAEYETSSLTLQPGDKLLLFTDGVNEAMNGSEAFYSDERLAGLLDGLRSVSHEELVKAVVQSVHEFADGAPQADDITVMSLRYGAAADVES
jgi:phosphoserine phosphatase RsbU/P